MSGGQLVYMRTLTNTPAGGVSMFCAHVTSYGRGHDVGLTTRDANLSALPLPDSAGVAITYQASKLSGDVTTTQAADASGGKGFFAPAIDGEMTVVDGDGKIAQDIGGGHFVPVGWDVWVAEYDVDFPLSPKTLVQLQVVDYSVAAGCVRFALRSPSYLANPLLHGARTLTQLATDPVDSSKPTDPTYLVQSVAAQPIGMAVGSIPVSLKVPAALSALVVARYAQTDLKQGDIGYGAKTSANTVSLKADLLHYSGTVSPEGTGPTDSHNFIEFWCRDYTEVARLNDEMIAIVAAGYRLIVSDGNWFANISDSYIPWEPLSYTNNTVTPNISRNVIRIYLDYSASESMLPFENIDPTQVLLFAAPSSVAISRDQCILEGFARNRQTTHIAGNQTYDGSVQVLIPMISSASDFIGFRPITDIGIGFSTDPSRLGAIEVLSGLISALSDFGASTGSINSIVQDPFVGWDSVTAPVSIIDGVPISQLESHPLVFRIRAQPMKATLDADFFVVDTTYSVEVVSGSSGPTSFPVFVRACGVFARTSGAPYGDVYQLPVTAHGQTVIASHRALRSIERIDWWRKIGSLQEMSDNLAPRFEILVSTGNPPVGDTCIISSVTAQIMETFVWAFQKFGFSDIYATVYPFWSKANLAALSADGAGTVVAGGVGITSLAANGSQSWQPSPLVDADGNLFRSTRGCYGAGVFAILGDYPGGERGVWISPTGLAGSWTYAALSAVPAGSPLRIRFFGGLFIVVFAGGSIQTSADGVTWSAPVVVSALGIQDIASDGTNYVAFGPAGHTYTSTDLASWVDVPAAGIDGVVLCAVWTGINFVAMGIPAASAAKAYLAGTAAALAGSWTAFDMGVSGIVEDAAWNGLGIVAVGQDVGIMTSGEGDTWSNPMPNALANPSWIPRGAGVVWTGGAWAVGGVGQFVTFALDKGRATWIPWFAATPEQGLQQMMGRFLGGLHFDSQNGSTNIWNPLRWTGGKATAQSWGIAFDPPENANSGTTATAGARKICEEWWFQAGEMPSTVLDGSSDQIEMALPEINLGNIEDLATLITVQYQPFGGEYLGKAYIQNVDVDRATAGKPDSFFFAGWDEYNWIGTPTHHGRTIWTACREAYLKTGALRSVSLTYDSVHDAGTLGDLWTTVDADLGRRIDWLCERPQYLKVMVYGNTSAAATAYCGARYKPNFAMLNARGMSALNATGYGVVVNVSHNFTTGEHALELAFPPA